MIPYFKSQNSAFISLFLSFVSFILASPFVSFAEEPQADSLNSIIQTGIRLQGGEYLLGPGDELHFRVLMEPEYTVDKVLVQPDGKLSLPGVGLLDVGSRSVSEVIDIIQSRLSKTIKNPQVSLSLLHPRAATVYLSGAVMRPGMFQINSSNTQQSGLNTTGNEPVARVDLRLSNILAVAGGVTMNADLTQIEIHRANGGAVSSVDLWKVLKGSDVTQDLLLSSGDTIIVPAMDAITLDDQDFETLLRSSIGPKSFPVRVIGETNAPGVYNIDGTSPYLNTAIAKAGGYAPQASRRAVAVRRFSSPNKFSDLYIAPEQFDFFLRPNDIIVVGENKVYKAGRFMRQASEILSPFQSLSVTGSSASQTFGFGGWGPRRF